ncbi:GNAT family N-acetyltransferase [Candidatus Sumerlaeota bacterium]|nr:GNAT family N-acetyltransferase [Candidatus Sumerlaeota bacterium]
MFHHWLDAETEVRMLEERDAGEMFALTDANRAHLRQWLPWLDTTVSVEDTRRFIQGGIEQNAANLGFQAGIRVSGVMAGQIGFHKIDWANHRVMLGYWLGREYTGRGLITRAAAILSDYAFGHYGLNRVEIHCATENSRSRAIPERIGFTFEGILRQGEWLYDHYVDLAVYAMLAAEWKSKGLANPKT